MTPEITTTKNWYHAANYPKYMALDVNTRMGASVWDLNNQIDIRVTGVFDLVVDNGTGEHLFNQYQVWKNHHDLTRDGGVLLKIMPFTPWINHGFFNFNPIIYRDVAKANGYKWLFFWINDRVTPPENLPTDDDSWVFVEKRPKQLIEYTEPGDWTTDLYMVAAWQKVDWGMGSERFQMPLQGKYLKDVEDDGLSQRYSGSAV